MLLRLSRVDYLRVGCTSRKTMCLLPVSKKDGTNHIVVGDHNGTLSIFSVQEGIAQEVTKTQSDKMITRVELAGPADHPRNRIFYAAGTEIRGLTRTGKNFLRFNTNLSEEIRSMCVSGVDLFVCGDYTCLHYNDLKDERFSSLSDRIHDIVCLPGTDLRSVVACDDRSIRVLRDAFPVVSVETVGVPQVLRSLDDAVGPHRQTREDQVLYGTVDGQLGLVCLDSSAPKHLWERANDSRAGGVSSLDLFDVMGDAVPQLIVGREDGLVEVHAFMEDGRPEKKFSSRLEGSVTNACGGFAARSKFAEVVCCTFAGWVSALTTEPLRPILSLGETAQIDESTQKKLEALKAEMRELQTRVEVEKQNPKQPIGSVVRLNVKVKCKDSFRLDASDASHLLTIEVSTGIDHILVQSDVSLELDKNDSIPGTVVSITKNSSGSPFLATVRCELDHSTRLVIRLRTTEGSYGTLRAYVCPRGVHPKVTKLLQYDIKPLSLHQRTADFDQKRPLNVLQLTGNYSLAEVHSWLSFCLPGLPDKAPADDRFSYSFVSTLFNTVVECTFTRGQGSILSDNLTTIMILSDAITRQATRKKASVKIRCTIDEQSIAHTLRLIHQALSEQMNLFRKVQVVETLRDLTSYDKNTTACLTPSNQALLREADTIVEEQKKKSLNVERLRDAVIRLFMDNCRYRGWNSKARISSLRTMLSSGSFGLQDVVDFFMKTGPDSTDQSKTTT